MAYPPVADDDVIGVFMQPVAVAVVAVLAKLTAVDDSVKKAPLTPNVAEPINVAV